MDNMYGKQNEAFGVGMPAGQEYPAHGAHMPYNQNVPAPAPIPMSDQVVPVNCSEVMNVTTVSDLHRYAQGTVVRFPDFAGGQPFVARVRRPSMLVLAKSGKIPNSLLNTASELFAKGGKGLDTDDKNMLSNFYDTCKIICEAALLQPTMAEIESAGITLSDDQIMAIFNYTQTGVQALQSFRKK